MINSTAGKRKTCFTVLVMSLQNIVTLNLYLYLGRYVSICMCMFSNERCSVGLFGPRMPSLMHLSIIRNASPNQSQLLNRFFFRYYQIYVILSCSLSANFMFSFPLNTCFPVFNTLIFHYSMQILFDFCSRSSD